jgi:hypothetical protein
MPEPQTKWMIIRVLGFCAKLNPKIAAKGIEHAERFYEMNAGVCLSGDTSLYLGDVGAVSPSYAKKVFPILSQALSQASINEVDWILEGFTDIYDNLNQADQNKIVKLSKKYLKASKRSTQQRVERIIAKAKK